MEPQPVEGNDPAGLRGGDGENRPLVAWAEVGYAAVTAGDLEGAEQPEGQRVHGP
ncbi:hypothetical protein GCM10010116_14710 [Microbispora rosea subsp. aerata]|nr:hypothetical protein GCM10010116_14710 [Microbispora rosea subsp. aerata]GIH53171.1 hypothetical protein Mro02_00850 [Microbispora rosea subsp. aerata]GLJ83917.1 hypothetical protein GCM10017588_26450 [Microbispora rosea subsp. aerata]